VIVLAVALAGAMGTLLRYVVDQAVRRRWPRRSTAPILLVNVTGSLLLGLLTGLAMFHGVPGAVLTVAGVGFCGSYTTFSTATYETFALLRASRYGAAASHLTATVGGSTLAAAAGLLLAALP
jgi:CrcB protein